MKKRIFRNPHLVFRRKKRLPPKIDYDEEEVYQQSLMLRRFAKRVTGSPFIRLDGEGEDEEE